MKKKMKKTLKLKVQIINIIKLLTYFKTNKIINGENRIDKIIGLFYKEETSRIKIISRYIFQK